jgi:tRNA (cmo5U34)-methyltransferase
MTTPSKDFSFGDHASTFVRHISSSVPGYRDLVTKSVRLSRRFIQSGTHVYDLGCSTGHLLRRIQRENHTSRPGVTYTGIDREPAFEDHWIRQRAPDLDFRKGDVRTWPYEKASLVASHFTVQFIPPMDKRALLNRVYDSLVEGGALIIAEKTLAASARLQDALTFPYYDYKLERGFTPEQILAKERSLRGQMTLLSEAELLYVLRQVGFSEIERVWGEAPFAGFLALK